MTAEELQDNLYDTDKVYTNEELVEALDIFGEDAENECALLQGFFVLYENAKDPVNTHLGSKFTNVVQKYAANVETKPSLRREFLSRLYNMLIEYFFTIGAYAESLRYVNKILDAENVPDDHLGFAISNAMEIMLKSGFGKQSHIYVEAMRTFSLVADLNLNNQIMVDMKLCKAYIFLRDRDRADYYLDHLNSYSSSELTGELRSVKRLFEFEAEAAFSDGRKPSEEYIRRVVAFFSDENFKLTISSDLSDSIMSVFNWIKDYVNHDLMIEWCYKLAMNSPVLDETLMICEFASDELGAAEEPESKLCKLYREALTDYYKNTRDARKNEVLSEIVSYNLERSYREKAFTDKLTGIGNRHAYERELEKITDYSGTELPDENLIIMVMDLNGLKSVNDNYGHQMGDKFIKGAANIIFDVVGTFGMAFRTGGDEFTAIVNSEFLSGDDVIGLLKKECERWSKSNGIELSIAVGYASAKDNPECLLEELAGIADKEMYKAKSRYYVETGRDRRK